MNFLSREGPSRLRGSATCRFLLVMMLCGRVGMVSAATTDACAPDPCDSMRAGAEPRAPEEGGEWKRPNILLIGIETLRADHVGCLGYQKDTTPTLDRLAREGVLCTRTMSTSGWTLPSVMSVMTSLYPDVHRVRTYEDKLSGGIATLAQIAKTAGYATMGIVSNPTIEGKYGFSEGFDLYDDFTIALDFGLDMFQSHDGIVADRHLTRTSELVTKTAVKWLQTRPAEPFLLFAFYFDPHYDYIPPAPFDTMFDPNYEGDMDGRGVKDEPRHSRRPSDRDLQHLLALYDGEIRYTDGYVGELLRAFDESPARGNTLVVVFGDHGDEFYEHGKTTHSRTLYNEIVHVPLILRWPGRLPAGRRIDALASLVDVLPTVLDCAGVPYEGPMQGISLRPLLEGKTGPLRDTLWAELSMENHLQAVLSDRYRLFRDSRHDTWELYDLHRDPGEQINLYDQAAMEEIRLKMAAAWQSRTKDNRTLAESLAQGREVEKVPLNEQQLQKLKALGYVQ